MNGAWYRVFGMAFGVFSAFAAGLIAFLALRQNRRDRKTLDTAMRDLPGAGEAYALRVVSAEGGRRVSAGDRFSVPDEGTLGSARSCDIVIPYRGVRGRAAFFWAEPDGLHITPLSREGLLADGERAKPGEEAILPEGSELRIGKLTMRLMPAGKGRAPLAFRLRKEDAAADGDRPDQKRKPDKKKPDKEIKNQRGKKRAQQREKAGTDPGKAARAKTDAGRAAGGAARGKADGRENPGKASGHQAFFRRRLRNRAADRRL